MKNVLRPGSSGYNFSTDWLNQGICIAEKKKKRKNKLYLFSSDSPKRKAASFFFSVIVHPPFMHHGLICSLRHSHVCSGSSQAQPVPHPRDLLLASGIRSGLKAHAAGLLGARDALPRFQGGLGVCLPHFCPPSICQSVCLSSGLKLPAASSSPYPAALRSQVLQRG